MSAITQRLSRRWYVLRDSRPGERFQKVWESRCQDRGWLWLAMRHRMLATSAFLLLAGILVANFVPLPAVSIVVLGLALAVRESLTVAQWMDQTDRCLENWLSLRRVQRRDRSGPSTAHGILRPTLTGAAFATITAVVLLLMRS